MHQDGYLRRADGLGWALNWHGRPLFQIRTDCGQVCATSDGVDDTSFTTQASPPQAIDRPCRGSAESTLRPSPRPIYASPQLAVFNFNLVLRVPSPYLSFLLLSSPTTSPLSSDLHVHLRPTYPARFAMAPVAGFVPEIITNVLRSPFLRKGNKTPRKGATTDDPTASPSVPHAGPSDAAVLQSSPRIAKLDNQALSTSVEVCLLIEAHASQPHTNLPTCRA